jgi:hypothetical protein
MSVVNTSQRPAKNACWICASSPITTGRKLIRLLRKYSLTFSSVVVPGCTQIVAPFSCSAFWMFAALRTMKPWPS